MAPKNFPSAEHVPFEQTGLPVLDTFRPPPTAQLRTADSAAVQLKKPRRAANSSTRLNTLSLPSSFLDVFSAWCIDHGEVAVVSGLMRTCKHARDSMMQRFWARPRFGPGYQWDRMLQSKLGGAHQWINTLHIVHPIPTPVTKTLNWQLLTNLPFLQSLHITIPSSSHFISPLSFFPFKPSGSKITPNFPSLERLHIINDPGSTWAHGLRRDPMEMFGEAFGNVDLGETFPVLREWRYEGDPWHLAFLQAQVCLPVPVVPETVPAATTNGASAATSEQPQPGSEEHPNVDPAAAPSTPIPIATVIRPKPPTQDASKPKTTFPASTHIITLILRGTPRAELHHGQTRDRSSGLCTLNGKGEDGWEAPDIKGQGKGKDVPVEWVVGVGRGVRVLRLGIDVNPNEEYFRMDLAPLSKLKHLREVEIRLNQRLPPLARRFPSGKYAIAGDVPGEEGENAAQSTAHESLAPWAFRKTADASRPYGLILTNLRFAMKRSPSNLAALIGVLPKYPHPEHLLISDGQDDLMKMLEEVLSTSCLAGAGEAGSVGTSSTNVAQQSKLNRVKIITQEEGKTRATLRFTVQPDRKGFIIKSTFESDDGSEVLVDAPGASKRVENDDMNMDWTASLQEATARPLGGLPTHMRPIPTGTQLASAASPIVSRIDPISRRGSLGPPLSHHPSSSNLSRGFTNLSSNMSNAMSTDQPMGGGLGPGVNDLTFAKLCDLKMRVEVKISHLQGKLPRRTFSQTLAHPEHRHAYMQTDGFSDLYITIQLYSDGEALCLPMQTATKVFKTGYTWNHTLILPLTYSSLPRDAELCITVWDILRANTPVAVGGTTLRLFSGKGSLKRGQQRCFLHLGREAGPAPSDFDSVGSPTPSDVHQDDEVGRLDKLVKAYERGDMPRVDWLDAMVFREIEKVNAKEALKSDKVFLYVDLPRFDFPVVFAEQEATLPLPPPPIPNPLALPTPSPLPANFLSNSPHLWRIYDPESLRIRADVNGEGNPVEAKYRRLGRSHRTGRGDRELKPGPEMRDLLNDLFRQPPTYSLSPEDKDIIWRYRFSLNTFKRSLTKFLKSVTWSDAAEARQAVEVLLPLWTEVGMDDALELLGPGLEDGRVRAFAVKQLGRADDDELLLYLLQLVQALKFEIKPDNIADASTSSLRGKDRPDRSVSRDPLTKHRKPSEEDSGLAEFLISRAVQNPILGTAFHWYLQVEMEDRIVGKMYGRVAKRFTAKLVETDQGAARGDMLRRQGEMVAMLSTRAKDLRASKDARPKKIDKLRAFLGDHKNGLSSMSTPLTLPLDARVELTGIVPERSSVFKSNLFPLLLWFETTSEEGEYPIIFKNGDDLRQDQLVIQLFTLMDRLLRKENLDLKLSPYAVLATGSTEGMIQFVPSKSLAAIMGEHGSLLNYLKLNYANEGAIGSLGVEPAVLDTFIRSCAGYSVLTYLLGVGDRHLDNLMLSPDGHFFHVDFGYILGRDPKPFPPPVKVCREMVDAMGGPSSPHYTRFKSLCYTAFISLRKNANLILNLIALMIDANIQDIRLEPDKAVQKVQEKFMLEMQEEDAIKTFEVMLNETSYLTLMFDKVHTLAQYLRE